jgi:hypothetical protein
LHITWMAALMVVLGERGPKKPLTEEEADHFLYVVYRRTIPLEVDDAINQVREIMKDPKEARRLTT